MWSWLFALFRRNRAIAAAPPSAEAPSSPTGTSSVADHRVVFFTHFGEKYKEVSRLLGAGAITQFFDAELPTFEDLDISPLAEKRVRLLHKSLGGKRACFLEECSLVIDELNYPGHEFRCIVNKPKYFRQWAVENDGREATIRIAVAFADASGNVSSFEASQKGTIIGKRLDEAAWGRGIGWDPIWQPAGFTHTLGELLSQKHFIDPRMQLYTSMRELLNPAVSDVTFEIHLTMALPDTCRDLEKGTAALIDFESKFQAACGEENQKALTIFENHGDNLRQVQFQTAQYRCFESIKAATEFCYSLSKAFVARGFVVARARAEAMAFSKFTPKTDEEGRAANPLHYFEFHLRVAVQPTKEAAARAIQALKAHELAPAVQPHLSWVGPKLFLNCRFMHPMGYAAAEERFKRMIRAVSDELQQPIVKKTLHEYAVFDDAVDFDDDPTNPSVVPVPVYDSFISHVYHRGVA